MTTRRQVVIALAAFAAPLASRAQTPTPPRRIAWITPTTIERDKGNIIDAFKARMAELGRVEGRDYVLELREFGGRVDILPALTREIVASRPDVIVTAGSATIAALKKETKTVPIVFGTAADVVEQGFVARLGHPGGNITGVTLRSEVTGKLVQLVREVLPSARRIALLEHDGDPIAPRITARAQRAANALNLSVNVARVKRAEDFERAFADIVSAKAEALYVAQLSLFVRHSDKIAELASKARLPMFCQGPRGFTESALLSYSSDSRENYRRAAVMVDKILKGAKPGDLPVEEPDFFTLVVNMRVAKEYGVAIPGPILARADQVIE